MKSESSELTQKYLLLVKFDAKSLIDRIDKRRSEYMEVFSLKRNRYIFKEIFESRYQKANFSDLANLPIEVIELANIFYSNVEELYWYLKRTQDMPTTVEDEILRSTTIIKRVYENLSLYIDAELSGQKIEVDLLENEVASNFFKTSGEENLQSEEESYLGVDHQSFDENDS